MSEEADNNHIEQLRPVTDPDLRYIVDELIAPSIDEGIEHVRKIGAFNEALRHAHTAREQIIIEDEEITLTPEVQRTSYILADLVLTASPRTDDMLEHLQASRLETAIIDASNSKFDQSLASKIAIRQAVGQDINPLLSKYGPDSERIWNNLQEHERATRPAGNEPRMSATWVRSIAEKVRKMVDSGLGESAEGLAVIPSLGTLKHLTYCAFMDTLRANDLDPSLSRFSQQVMNERDISVKPGVLVLHSTSNLLDMATGVLYEHPNALKDDMSRITGVGKVLKISTRDNMRVARTGSLTSAKHLSPAGKLAANAHEVMVGVHMIRKYIQPLGVQDAVSKARISIGLVRDQVLTVTHQIYEDFYTRVDEMVADRMVTDELALEMLTAERYVHARLRALLNEAYENDLATEHQINEIEAAMPLRLDQEIKTAISEQQLAELAEWANGVKTQITELEAPYTYTSKKIRGFEGGTNLLRDLAGELDRLDTLHGDETREELAIILLQAKTASDKTMYYNKLHDDRYEIEKNLAELKYLGMHEQSRLTDILHWIDEVIDSGAEDQVRFKPLEDFINEYYLGPETVAHDTTTQDSVIDLTEEQPETPEETEPTSEPEQPSAKKERATESNEQAIAQYFGELQEVLDTLDIEYAEVDVFPPDHSGKARDLSGEKDEVSRFIDIDPKRLQGLVRLKKAFEHQGKSVRLIATRPTKWAPLPHFALYIQEDPGITTGVCILENPVNGNASYVYSVDGELIQAWEELAVGTRKNAREFGAIPFVHPTKEAGSFNQHYDIKLLSHTMQQLASLRAKARQSTAV